MQCSEIESFAFYPFLCLFNRLQLCKNCTRDSVRKCSYIHIEYITAYVHTRTIVAELNTMQRSIKLLRTPDYEPIVLRSPSLTYRCVMKFNNRRRRFTILLCLPVPMSLVKRDACVVFVYAFIALPSDCVDSLSSSSSSASTLFSEIITSRRTKRFLASIQRRCSSPPEIRRRKSQCVRERADNRLERRSAAEIFAPHRHNCVRVWFPNRYNNSDPHSSLLLQCVKTLGATIVYIDVTLPSICEVVLCAIKRDTVLTKLLCLCNS